MAMESDEREAELQATPDGFLGRAVGDVEPEFRVGLPG